LLYPLVADAWRGIGNIRFDQRYTEGTFRIVFATAAVAGFGAISFLGR
jgi:hypothetical protein